MTPLNLAVMAEVPQDRTVPVAAQYKAAVAELSRLAEPLVRVTALTLVLPELRELAVMVAMGLTTEVAAEVVDITEEEALAAALPITASVPAEEVLDMQLHLLLT
jgi:uncharacterized protein YebE (UPF0316 family)